MNTPRPREHLTEAEIDRLMTVARTTGRYGHRDATVVLIAYRHGLRSSELVALEWDQIDLAKKTLRLWRAKRGGPFRTTWPTLNCVHSVACRGRTPPARMSSSPSAADHAPHHGFGR
jgi:integrase